VTQGIIRNVAHFLCGASLAVLAMTGSTATLEPSMAYVRWSELEIDREQLARFEMLANENIQQTRRTEPGVIAFYSRAERDRPNRLRVLEIYADARAYQAHLQSPHFQVFRTATSQMVTDRKLFEAVPVALGAKPQSSPPDAVVRIAELEIDPGKLDAYKAIVIEEIGASVRVEPGVVAIYALALKDRPNHLRFFEIYADEQAYLGHRNTPHFKKYLEATQGMIRTRRLIETAAPTSGRN
jgi:quinol monooxygenase YgiN